MPATASTPYPLGPQHALIRTRDPVQPGRVTVIQAGVAPTAFSPVYNDLSEDDLKQAFWAQTKAGLLCDWQIRQRCEAYGLFEPFVDHQVTEEEYHIVEGSDGYVTPKFDGTQWHPHPPGPQGRTERRKIISYGLTSFGYDVRLAGEYKVFNNRRGGLIDPLAFDSEKLLVSESGPYCNIPPNSYILARTLERFRLQPNQVTDCLGKSTYARCGLIINVTPAEPEWEGYLTLELANATPCPLRVYAGMGIAQIRVYEGPRPAVTYASRAGKYQDQPAEPVAARV